MTQLIERSILATVISSDMLIEGERTKIQDVELYEEWFTIHNYKIIVKIINSLKAKNKPFTMEMIIYYGFKNGLNMQSEIEEIMCFNGFGTYGTFINYLQELKKNIREDLQDLI